VTAPYNLIGLAIKMSHHRLFDSQGREIPVPKGIPVTTIAEKDWKQHGGANHYWHVSHVADTEPEKPFLGQFQLPFQRWKPTWSAPPDVDPQRFEQELIAKKVPPQVRKAFYALFTTPTPPPPPPPPKYNDLI
jgi:hypothetical protein